MDEFEKLLNAYTEALEKANEWPGVRSHGLARYKAKMALMNWAHSRVVMTAGSTDVLIGADEDDG